MSAQKRACFTTIPRIYNRKGWGLTYFKNMLCSLQIIPHNGKDGQRVKRDAIKLNQTNFARMLSW